MNYQFPTPVDASDDPDDIFLRSGDAMEIDGKVFVVEGRSVDPRGFIVSDPDAPGSERKFTNKQIKGWFDAHRLRFVSRDEFGLPIGIRDSLRRTMRAFQPSERSEMFRRLRYCKAIDALGPEFSRSEAGMQETCDDVAAKRNDDGPHHWATVLRWWKDWTRAGRDVRALCPSIRRRGNRKSQLPDYMELAIQKGLKHWLRLGRPKMSSAYNAVVNHCTHHHGGEEVVVKLLEEDPDAYLWPSYKTFTLACKGVDRTTRLVNRHGEQAARYEMYPVGAGPAVTFPMERVEADFKYLRLFIVDDKTGLPLGTPYLMAAIDCFSGVVVGYDLGFDPPSYVAAARCLKNIIQPKDLSGFPKREDGRPIIRNAYPVNGVPHQFFIDNDAAFHAESFEMSAAALGCHIDYVPPGHPWDKGKIERFWGTVQTTFFDMFPGKVLRIGEKAAVEYDPKKDAVVTLSQAHLLITKALVDVHHEGIEPGTDKRRIDLWNEGVAIHPPRPVRDKQSLLELVGAYKVRKAERRGIRLFGLRYNSSELAQYRSGFEKDPRVEIRYDPQDIAVVWVIDRDQGISFKVPCTRPDYVAGLSEHQHNVVRRHAADRSPAGRLRMRQLQLAKAELFELGQQIVGSRHGSRTKTKIARFLGVGRELIDEINRPINDAGEDSHLDLEEVEDPEDEAEAKKAEALVDQLRSGGVERSPRKPRVSNGATVPDAGSDAYSPPVDPPTVEKEASGAPPQGDLPPSDPHTPRSRRSRDRTIKVSHG